MNNLKVRTCNFVSVSDENFPDNLVEDESLKEEGKTCSICLVLLQKTDEILAHRKSPTQNNIPQEDKEVESFEYEHFTHRACLENFAVQHRDSFSLTDAKCFICRKKIENITSYLPKESPIHWTPSHNSPDKTITSSSPSLCGIIAITYTPNSILPITETKLLQNPKILSLLSTLFTTTAGIALGTGTMTLPGAAATGIALAAIAYYNPSQGQEALLSFASVATITALTEQVNQGFGKISGVFLGISSGLLTAFRK